MLDTLSISRMPLLAEQVQGRDGDVEDVLGMTSLGGVKLARHPGLSHFMTVLGLYSTVTASIQYIRCSYIPISNLTSVNLHPG